MNTEASACATAPLASFEIQISEKKFETPGDDDFRITVPEINEQGPVILVHRYERGAFIPARHEGLSYFLMQRLTMAGVKFKAMDEYHVRVRMIREEAANDDAG